VKILQCINSLSAGGAEVFAVSLAISLKKLGCDVELYTYSGAIDDKGQELEKLLTNAAIPHRSPLLRKNYLKPLVPLHITKTLGRFKPDICHAHLDQSDFFLLLGKKLSPHTTKLVRTIHSVYPFDRLPAYIQRWIAHSYEANIACGPAAFEQHPYIGTGDFTINNGIDLASIKSQISEQEIRKILDVPADTPILLSIGSFWTRNGQLPKAQDVIVQAMAERIDQNFVVVFLGEGDQRSAIEELARSLGVLSQCRFLGRVTNPGDYLHACDGVLMPSRFEGLSIGCIEAVCAGKPVIASNISAFSPFMRPSTLFVESESIQGLADALGALLINADHYSRLAAEHQAYYCEEFDIQTVARRYLDFYQKLLVDKK
jgi:glycosyltransferase involved in cell wall biosynthesis